MASTTVTIETNTHTIEKSSGCLTIGEGTSEISVSCAEKDQIVVNTFASMVQDVLHHEVSSRTTGLDGFPLDM